MTRDPDADAFTAALGDGWRVRRRIALPPVYALVEATNGNIVFSCPAGILRPRQSRADSLATTERIADLLRQQAFMGRKGTCTVVISDTVGSADLLRTISIAWAEPFPVDVPVDAAIEWPVSA